MALKALDRHDSWRVWLHSGEPLTPAARDAILTDIEPRIRPGPFLDALRSMRTREPGADDDLP